MAVDVSCHGHGSRSVGGSSTQAGRVKEGNRHIGIDGACAATQRVGGQCKCQVGRGIGGQRGCIAQRESTGGIVRGSQCHSEPIAIGQTHIGRYRVGVSHNHVGERHRVGQQCSGGVIVDISRDGAVGAGGDRIGWGVEGVTARVGSHSGSIEGETSEGAATLRGNRGGTDTSSNVAAIGAGEDETQCTIHCAIGHHNREVRAATGDHGVGSTKVSGDDRHVGQCLHIDRVASVEEAVSGWHAVGSCKGRATKSARTVGDEGINCGVQRSISGKIESST